MNFWREIYLKTQRLHFQMVRRDSPALLVNGRRCPPLADAVDFLGIGSSDETSLASAAEWMAVNGGGSRIEDSPPDNFNSFDEHPDVVLAPATYNIIIIIN